MKKFIKILFIFIMSVLIGTGIFYLSIIPSIRTTWALATTVQPERFTELFFDDHTKLPSQIESEKHYTFKFSVHNLEYQDTKYGYATYIDLGNKKITIDTGTFTLKQDQVKTIKQTFSFTDPFEGPAKVVVKLTNKNNQQIDFWILNKQPQKTEETPDLNAIQISGTETKQYGGWYWQPDLQKAQIWLGKDYTGLDIWSDTSSL